MDLQSWETNGDGTPINGATVEAYVSSGLNLVPPGAVVASTTTNAQGYWTLTGLADVAHDVKVTDGSQVRWYKGLTQFSVKSIIGDNFTPLPANILHNSGFELWRPGTSFSIPASQTGAAHAEGWSADTVAGDSVVISQETTIIASSFSRRSLKAIYTKGGAGPLYIYQTFTPPMVYTLRGKTIYFTIQCRQGVGNNVTPFLTEGGGAGTTNGSTNATTGSFITLSVTKALASTTTSLTAGVAIAAADTVYLDNAVFCISAVAPTYVPHGREGGDTKIGDIDTHALPLVAAQLFMGAV